MCQGFCLLVGVRVYWMREREDAERFHVLQIQGALQRMQGSKAAQDMALHDAQAQAWSLLDPGDYIIIIIVIY